MPTHSDTITPQAIAQPDLVETTRAPTGPSFAPRPMGERRFGRVNRLGVATLCRRETARFLKVSSQTLIAPVVTAAIFLAVFTLALGARRAEVLGVPFATFLAPGVVMMTVLQNAFANTSSSMIIAKVQGSIVDSLTPPLSPGELTFGFVFGGVARGVAVAALTALALFPWVGVGFAQPLWAIFFTLAGATILSLLGLAAGIWSVKFDHIAAVTNFVVTPLSFLSGTFYDVRTLPEPWATLSLMNPMFYLVDGFRYGAIGVRETDPWIGAAVSLTAIAGLWWLCRRMFATGYKLKS